MNLNVAADHRTGNYKHVIPRQDAASIPVLFQDKAVNLNKYMDLDDCAEMASGTGQCT